MGGACSCFAAPSCSGTAVNASAGLERSTHLLLDELRPCLHSHRTCAVRGVCCADSLSTF